MPLTGSLDSDVIEKRCPVTGWSICSRPEWRYAEKDFSIRYEILNGRIVHSIAEGYLKEDYIQKVDDLRRKILEKASDLPPDPVPKQAVEGSRPEVFVPDPL